MLRLHPRRLLLVLAASSLALAAGARENINLNREWKFLLGDTAGAEAPAFDAGAWSDIHLPHSFSLPYFMWPEFYVGHGWYRKTLDVPADWLGKRVALELVLENKRR